MKTRVRFTNPNNNPSEEHERIIAEIVANTICASNRIPPSKSTHLNRIVWLIAGSWALVFDSAEKDIFTVEGIPCFSNDHKDSQDKINALHRWLVFNPNIGGAVEEIPGPEDKLCYCCAGWKKKRLSDG